MILISNIGGFSMMHYISNDLTMAIGAPAYMAPEVLSCDNDYNEKVDVYSFGVIMYMMLNQGEMPKINIVDIGAGKKAPIPNTVNEFSKILINECWNFNPEDRPSFDTICQQLRSVQYNVIDLRKDQTTKLLEMIEKHDKILPK